MILKYANYTTNPTLSLKLVAAAWYNRTGMTKDELTKLLDEKLTGIVAGLEEIGGRVSTIEDGMAGRSDLLYLRKELGKLEKRYAALQGRLAKTTTQSDLETTTKDFNQKLRAIEKSMATKQDLKRLEKKLSDFFDYLDKDVMEDRKRIERLETHLGLAA
jgi:chromosome segregation ATPase